MYQAELSAHMGLIAGIQVGSLEDTTLIDKEGKQAADDEDEEHTKRAPRPMRGGALQGDRH